LINLEICYISAPYSQVLMWHQREISWENRNTKWATTAGAL